MILRRRHPRNRRATRFRSFYQKYRDGGRAPRRRRRELGPRAVSFRDSAPARAPMRFERPTDRADSRRASAATCVRVDMGNVQCCAGGRFHEGRPAKKPKDKKKNEKQKSSDISDKNNGLGICKTEEKNQKIEKVAEERSEKAAPASLPAEAAHADAPDATIQRSNPVEQQTRQTNITEPSSIAPPHYTTESMATARERFFGQVKNK